ncbi:alaserpin-like isoform X1 [Maniola jurtina]|uniref:alaserpin-like isoform X1 n=2 Tax=Maniola jurtina TaxID=191418 RepID=UPI001E6894CA|nr:alaserpin-like isoform X1 [Maniola jurtina]XP_045765083.1 alaserpin-like isoform X1 [Maniola jurtina]
MKQIFYILCVLPLAVMAMSNGRNTESLLRDGSNRFTAQMFSEVTKTNPGKSVILSAISVMPPLAELALASVGDSHDELLQVLGTPNDDTTKAVFSYANKELKSAEGVTIKTANKIYIGKDYELNKDFAAVSKETFDSEIKNIDFGENAKAATEINTWVEDQTNHLIKDLVDPRSLGPDTKAVLVNAIYFKGTWADPFEKESTKDQDFHVNRNKVIPVPMMYRKGHYDYVESDELKSQIIEIPYKGYQASLVVVLPRDVEGILELEEKLKDPQVLDKVMKSSSRPEVIVHMPRFKIETTTNLKDVLIKMNVSKLFKSDEAKLHHLLKNADDLYIDSALQKAFIEVNEFGTEAAAANVFHAVGASFVLNPEEPKVFNADRPFYFAIKMNSLTLFNGVMYGS